MLGEDRGDEVERGRDDRRQGRDRQLGAQRRDERAQPGQLEPLDGGVVERRCRAERRTPSGPLLGELGPRVASQPAGRVGDPDVLGVDRVEDHPVVAVPVDDRRELQVVETIL